jgi:hypothetical protein
MTAGLEPPGRMKLRFAIALVMLCLFVAAALPAAYAQAPNPPTAQPWRTGAALPARPMMLPRTVCLAQYLSSGATLSALSRDDTLGLTPDQRQKLSALGEKFGKPALDAAAGVEEANKAMLQQLTAETVSADKLKSAAADVNKAEAAVLQLEIDFWTEAKGLLTADQNKTLNEILTRPIAPRPTLAPLAAPPKEGPDKGPSSGTPAPKPEPAPTPTPAPSK